MSAFRNTLRAVIPVHVRRAIGSLAAFTPKNVATLVAAARQSNPRRTGISVSYGLLAIPEQHQVASGGSVKLQYLSKLFPPQRKNIDILYTVSSATPAGTGLLYRICKRRGIKIVRNQNGVYYQGWYGKGWQSANTGMAKLLHKADYVFYQSEFCREGADTFLGRYDGPCEVLHNAVDVKRFMPAERRNDGNPLVLLLAGSLGHWYRVEVALQTLREVKKQLPDARLIIAGRLAWTKNAEDAKRALLELASRLDLLASVEVSSPYSSSEAPAVITRGNVLLHPSYNDACPSLVLEAMACGLPVAHSLTGGTPELVGEAGIGVASPKSWAFKIQSAIAAPKK